MLWFVAFILIWFIGEDMPKKSKKIVKEEKEDIPQASAKKEKSKNRPTFWVRKRLGSNQGYKVVLFIQFFRSQSGWHTHKEVEASENGIGSGCGKTQKGLTI